MHNFWKTTIVFFFNFNLLFDSIQVLQQATATRLPSFTGFPITEIATTTFIF